MLFRFAIAIATLLTAVHHLFPVCTRKVLPLGGDDFIQMSALLLIAVALNDLYESRRKNKK